MSHQNWYYRPPTTRQGVQPVVIVSTLIVIAFWMIVLTVWVPDYSQWHDRNCPGSVSAYMAITRGAPSTFEYCPSAN